MKKTITFLLLTINIIGADSYDIKNIINQKKTLENNKEKYINENISLSQISLLNFEIELLNNEIELIKGIKDYRKEKTSLEIFIENENLMKNFYEEKFKFYNDYLKNMEKNKEKFSTLDIDEARVYVYKVLEEKKSYEKSLEISKWNYNNFYSDNFTKDNFNYEKELEDKMKKYTLFLDKKSELINISKESIYTFESFKLEKEKIINLLNKEKILLETQKQENRKKYDYLQVKLNTIEKEIEYYTLKAQKKQKEINLGLITQKEYFDFFNEKFNIELKKNEIQREIKLLEIEMQ